MKTEQKNTKKIVVIIVAVLAILLAVAGLTFWSVHVYRANNDPQPSGVTESGGESLLGSKPAGEESHTPSKNGNATQSGSKPTSGKQDGTDSFSDLGIPEEILGQLTDPNATLPAVKPEETATDAAVWGSEDEKPSGGTPVKNLSTVQQIVAYFNTAANQVKSGKPALEAKATMRVRENITGTSEAENSSQSYKKGANLNDVFPVAGQSWASKLDVKGIKSATCSEKGREILHRHLDEGREKPKACYQQSWQGVHLL